MPPRPHMRDKAQIGVFQTVSNGPEPVESYVYGSAVSCRFIRTSTREVLDGKEQDLTDVQIHFRADQTLTDASRIKLTRRNLTTLGTPEYYELVGLPWYTDDNRTIVCNCQSMPTGAE